jgi:acylphosphatase
MTTYAEIYDLFIEALGGDDVKKLNKATKGKLFSLMEIIGKKAKSDSVDADFENIRVVTKKPKSDDEESDDEKPKSKKSTKKTKSDDDEDESDDKPLEKQTVTELRAEAKKCGIEGCSKMKKDALIEALNEAPAYEAELVANKVSAKLDKMTVKDLRSLASKRKISKASTMNKKDLVEALVEANAEECKSKSDDDEQESDAEASDAEDDDDDISKLTVKELKEKAKDLGIKGYSTMKKDALLKAIAKASKN